MGGDAVYDSEDILCFIIKDLKARAVIPRNPRGESTTPSYTFKGENVHCQADLPMHRKGKTTHTRTGITYLRYCCPIHFGKERQRYLICPATHPKFLSQKGCNVTIRLTPSIREQIDPGTEAFKELHNKRTAVRPLSSFRSIKTLFSVYQPGVQILQW